MKKSLSSGALMVLLILPLAACDDSSSSGPDAEVTFVDDGCTYNGPDGTVDSPLEFRLTNKTDHDEYGVVIATLDDGYGRADLEAYELRDPPGFAQMRDLLFNKPGETTTAEVSLEADREYFVICSRETERAVLEVLAVVTGK